MQGGHLHSRHPCVLEGGPPQLQIPPAQPKEAEACGMGTAAEPSQVQIPPSQPRQEEAFRMGIASHFEEAPSAASTPADRGAPSEAG